MEEENLDDYFKTDQARRETRRKLRDFLETLQKNRIDLSEIRNNKLLFQKYLQQAEDIFKHEIGEHVRELKFDALVMKELADLLKTQAVKLETMSKRYDYETFTTRLKSNILPSRSTDHASWSCIGHAVIDLWTGVPALSTMLGPIEREEKKRKVAERRQKDDANVAVQKAETVENEEGDNDEATSYRVQHLKQIVEKKTNEFDVLNFLYDHTDPVQTVENFFDFSFLVKERCVAVDWNKQKKTAIGVYIDPNKALSDKRQMILSISMKDLIRLKELEAKNPDQRLNPLHRDDEIYLAKNAREQVELLQNQNKRPASQNDGESNKKRRGK